MSDNLDSLERRTGDELRARFNADELDCLLEQVCVAFMNQHAEVTKILGSIPDPARSRGVPSLVVERRTQALVANTNRLERLQRFATRLMYVIGDLRRGEPG